MQHDRSPAQLCVYISRDAIGLHLGNLKKVHLWEQEARQHAEAALYGQLQKELKQSEQPRFPPEDINPLHDGDLVEMIRQWRHVCMGKRRDGLEQMFHCYTRDPAAFGRWFNPQVVNALTW